MKARGSGLGGSLVPAEGERRVGPKRYLGVGPGPPFVFGQVGHGSAGRAGEVCVWVRAGDQI